MVKTAPTYRSLKTRLGIKPDSSRRSTKSDIGESDLGQFFLEKARYGNLSFHDWAKGCAAAGAKADVDVQRIGKAYKKQRPGKDGEKKLDPGNVSKKVVRLLEKSTDMPPEYIAEGPVLGSCSKSSDPEAICILEHP